MAVGENYLVISDLQIPFEHVGALTFCKYLRKHYKVKPENVLCVGDELDEYYGSAWAKSPEAYHSAQTELMDARKRLKKWYAAFPKMKLAISNHGQRYYRKAMSAEIPSQFIRGYTEVFGFPVGWKLQKYWYIKGSKKHFIIEHGDDYGGQRPHVIAAMHNGVSTAIGHHHSICGVEHIVTNGFDIWGMASGSLIDFDQYAFEYARAAKRKPVVSAGVILDGGKDAITLRI